jgi:hydroxypyruvate isomerase
MEHIGICLDPVFTDLPYDERIVKIAGLGFKKYEFWTSGYSLTDRGMVRQEKDFGLIAELNARYGLETTDFLYDAGRNGEKSNITDKSQKGFIIDCFGAAAEKAKKINCPAFIISGGLLIPSQSRDASLLNLVDTLGALAKEGEKQGITLLLEPLNDKVDHKDTFLSDPRLSVDIIKAIDSPRLKLLYDMYHMQIMTGNILAFVKENLSRIGHFHIAGVPGRHEPYRGELDYSFILKEIRAAGYTGVFGLEYWPGEAAEISLRKSREYLSESL